MLKLIEIEIEKIQSFKDKIKNDPMLVEFIENRILFLEGIKFKLENEKVTLSGLVDELDKALGDVATGVSGFIGKTKDKIETSGLKDKMKDILKKG